MSRKIHYLLGDCNKILKKIPNDYFHSVVTDPPYGLKFMNKRWDYQIPSVETWKEIYRVLRPGGHILVACGTKTQHRMAVNIEDAGFEIRDVISWIYGSGFPKNLNVSKAIDKTIGFESKKVPVGNPVKRMIPCADQNATGSWIKDNGRIYQPGIDVPVSEAAKQWHGWGTALKPAMELFTLARKPLSESTVAKNVLKWGTGAINIDPCRVPYEKGAGETNINSSGRFPANVIHDGSDEVLDQFAKAGSTGAQAPVKGTEKSHKTKNIYGDYSMCDRAPSELKDEPGNAARFFYCAKASTKERGKGNNHPTVKPIKLMQYLIKMITPPNGIILDPYAGSGTTGIAAQQLNFKALLIEKNDNYYEILKSRLKSYL